MTRTETTGFSLQLAVVWLEHQQLSAHFLKSHVGLTYNEFTLLYALQHAIEPVSFSALTDFLMVRERTAFSELASLEEKRLLAKTEMTADRRRMLIAITPIGSRVVSVALHELCGLLQAECWVSLPKNEFSEYMLKNIEASLNSMRGHSAPGFGVGECAPDRFPVHHFVFWRVMRERWTAAIRQCSGLSLYQFLLILLIENGGPLTSADVARHLDLHVSVVSRYKEGLIAQGLVRECSCECDSRRKIMSNTKKAELIIEECCDCLNSIIQMVVDDNSTDDHARVNRAWIDRMYANLMSHRVGL